MRTYLIFDNNQILKSLKRYCNYILNISEKEIVTSLDYEIKNGYFQLDLKEDAQIISSHSNLLKEEIVEKINALYNYQLRKNNNLYLQLLEVGSINNQILMKYSIKLLDLFSNLNKPKLFNKEAHTEIIRTLNVFKGHS